MGTGLGRYVVLKHLASGGMADVLLGRSDGLEGFRRHVVLKRIRAEHARDQRFIRMFLDEARVAATLHHQHIVQVYDIGESDGEYFIAMEYIHGEDVRMIHSMASQGDGPIPLGHAIAIVSAAAAGLHHAHEQRGTGKRPLHIVHRDVSPSNILVGYDGSIKLVDFGIAKAAMLPETRSGSVKGKVAYMSPEQCTGGDVDRRSDVYALGVVLYELVTGTRMFKTENDYVVMDQIVNGRISPPREVRPELPEELSDIILRALAPERERRYATADDLRVALDRFATAAGLTVSTSGIATYMREQFGHRPEPWLESIVESVGSLDYLPTLCDASLPTVSLADSPRGDGVRHSERAAILRSKPIRVLASNAATGTAAGDRAPQRATIVPYATSPPPVDSKLGWESQQPTDHPPARHRTPKLVMIGAAVIVAIAVWRLSGTDRQESAEVAAPPAAQAEVPAPAITLTAAEPPRVIAVGPALVLSAASGPADATPPAPLAVPALLVAPEPPAASPAPVVVGAAAPGSGAKRAGPPSPHPVRTTRPTRPVAPHRAAPRRAAEVTPAPPRSPRPEPSRNPADRALEAPAGRVVPGPAPGELPHVALVPPPPPPPGAPQSVAPRALTSYQVAGEKNIVPDEVTMAVFGRSGNDTLTGCYKVCITSDGNIDAVTQLRSTGFPAYDAKIQDTIRGTWRYRPFLVNGKPIPVCTALRFVYSQK